MTEENRTPRRRRRRRRRTSQNPNPQSAPGNDGSPESGAEPQAGSGDGQNAQRQGQSQGQGQARKRSRRRRGRQRGPGGERSSEQAAPQESGTSEPAEVSGVLYIKSNGNGVLVNAANNFVPLPGDATVSRSTIDRLQLQGGLLLTGGGRRNNNGVEMTAVETIEGMPVEQFRESRRPFSELISIDPDVMFT